MRRKRPNACCPHCATPVPRSAYFRPHRECAVCREFIKPAGKWTAFDWVASGVFMLTFWGASALLVKGITLGLLSALFVALVYLAVGWVSFPYVTRYGHPSS